MALDDPTNKEAFYPWVMYVLTIRITEAFGLPKQVYSLITN